MRPIVKIRCGLIEIVPEDSVVVIDYDNFMDYRCPVCGDELDGEGEEIRCLSCQINWHDIGIAEHEIMERESNRC